MICIVETTGNPLSVAKLHVSLAASALPATSFTPVVIVTVYVVEKERLAVGVKVAVVPLYDTAPLILPVPLATVNVDVVMVDAFIASLNVAVMALFAATPVAPLAGIFELTVGVVVSSDIEPLAVAVLPAVSLAVTVIPFAPATSPVMV